MSTTHPEPGAPAPLSAETLADRLAAQTFAAATTRLHGLLSTPSAPAPGDRRDPAPR